MHKEHILRIYQFQEGKKAKNPVEDSNNKIAYTTQTPILYYAHCINTKEI